MQIRGVQRIIEGEEDLRYWMHWPLDPETLDLYIEERIMNGEIRDRDGTRIDLGA